MKKVIFSFILVFTFVISADAKSNPFMGKNQNQIAVNVGLGVNSGFLIPPPAQFVPYFMLPNIQYSQPTTFFRLPARQSLNFGETVGMGHKYGWNWTRLSIPMLFASEDVALIWYKCWYYSTGFGIGLQAQQNERIGTKLLFQFKIATGLRFSEHWGGEFFVQHFSNANTDKRNHSYAFYGLGITYSF